MQFRIIKILAGTALLGLFIISCTGRPRNELDTQAFLDPPEGVRINTWWHWLDGNITRDGITKDLEAMKNQGVVQATILNIGLFGDRDFGVPKVKFGTDQWFEMFRWSLQEADRLGIKLGAHNCDGWSSSGGPWITPEMSMKQFVWTNNTIIGGQAVKVVLREPFRQDDYYRDVAVVAYKTGEPVNSFLQSSPVIMLNDSADASCLTDGNPVSGIDTRRGDFIDIDMKEPLSFSTIAIHPRRSFMWGSTADFVTNYTFSVSDDGRQYRKIADFSIKGLNRTEYVDIPLTTARKGRLTLKEYSNMSDWIPVRISELELLKEGEKAGFSPSIPYISEKTTSVTAENDGLFYTSGNEENVTPSADVVILSDKMDADGTLAWDAPDGIWTVLRFGYTTTGATNGPATKEGRGLECDKMDSAAVGFHFRSYPHRLVEEAGKYAGNTFKFILIDSWECGFQNWTGDFPAEFEKLRGYSLIPYLPVLCGKILDSPGKSEAVLYDFRKTIADLIQKNYYERFSDLCHKDKVELHAEVIYGNGTYPPLDILASTECVDLPMYEFWTSTDKDMFVKYKPTAGPEFNMPSCAVTGYNKVVLGSEAYTGEAHYSESPSELKPFGDRAFCSGINQMILHSYVLQPTDRKPGMTLGQYASHFNRNNLYWQYISEWFNYQARLQYALREGTVAPDVLYYLGDQLPQFFTGNVSTSLPAGYRLNACNYDILKNRVKVHDGKLRMNDASDYAILSLPEKPWMDFKTLKLIGTLIDEGATVFGPKPEQTLSRADLEENQEAFHELADKIWGSADVTTRTENSYGKGQVLWGMDLGEALGKIRLEPDFSTNLSEHDIFQFIHRKKGSLEMYFVANQLDSIVNTECLFRVSNKKPEIWDPETGSVVRPAIFRIENNLLRIPFHFKPYQSALFVFSDGKFPDYITTVKRNGEQVFPEFPDAESTEIPLVTFDDKVGKVIAGISGDYEFQTRSGKIITGSYSQPEEADIDAFTGKIDFNPGYAGTIPPVEITSLKPLNEYEDQDIRYFAGNAIYTINFNATGDFLSQDAGLWLDTGCFDAVAEVTLNGKLLGRIWKPGTCLDVSGILKAENQLVVNVANVYRNRFIGDYIQYGKIKDLFTSSPIGQFLNKDRPLKSSGLIGPLKLIRIPLQTVSL